MKETIEYLGFDDEEFKSKVGRPKLADKKTKKKSLIIASFSFIAVAILLIFGYGTLFGFKSLNLKGTALGASDTNTKNILIESIKPVFKEITLKENTSRKLYTTITPSNATNKDLKYESSDSEVAIVDKEGKVSALKEGEATISVSTIDGSNKSTEFKVYVIKNADGKCLISNLTKTNTGINYNVECNNAKIKNVYYKLDNGEYSKLLTKKTSDMIPLSDTQKKKKITLKVVYYANNSSVSKYVTKSLQKQTTVTTTKVNGSCMLDINKVTINSAKYLVTCNNASVTNIAYKIGSSSYIGLDKSSLGDTVIFEESDVTRVIYFKVDYKIDGTNVTNSVTKTGVIQKKETPITTVTTTTNKN